MSAAIRLSYPAALMAEARGLHGVGWSAGQIHGVFLRRGLDPCPSVPQLRRWVNDSYAENSRRWAREEIARRRARTATFQLRGQSEEYLRAFAERLRTEGVARTSIAKVLTVVTSDPWSLNRVRDLLGERRVAA